MPRPAFSGFLGFAAALAAGLTLATPGSAAAQGGAALMSRACGTENLIAGKAPFAYQDVRGSLRLPTDGAAGPEGAQWDAPVGITFDTPAGSITYDLGGETQVSAFVLQADANDAYKVFGSLDGTPGSFKQIAEIDSALNLGHGLRTRAINVNPATVRYVRVGEAIGDNFYSISEFQVFCRAPEPFPPRMRTVDAPQARVAQLPWYKFGWWDNDASSRVEMLIAFLALALVGWGLYLTKKGTPRRFQKLRDGLLMAVGALSFMAYWNFGSFHFPNYLHVWDTYHYYVGSKYFNELAYDRLYDCVSVADAEDPALRRRVEMRKIMNLRTNILGGTADVLAHPENCKLHFSPERWEAFKKDVAFFRQRHGVKRWEEAQTDHGYNATPVWNIVGTMLANTGPATDTQIKVLTRIDPVFIIGITLLTGWAFGWRVMCIALAVFATNFPSRFYWTGGAYLRWDWLFYLIGGLCLLRKEKHVLGGFFLGYSTLLRVFPGLLFVAPLLAVVRQIWGTPSPERPAWKPQPLAPGERFFRGVFGRIERRYLALFGGAALAAAVLMPISLVTSGGIAGYKAFIHNTEKHKETPLTNYMGLRTVVAWKPSEVGRFLRSDKIEDPWGTWKKAKVRTFRERQIPYFLVVAGFIVLLWFATRGVEPWVACSMGVVMMAVGVELTCYYYSFLWGVALLYEKRREAGAILLGVTGMTGFLDWAPTKYLPQTKAWENLRMPQWLDEIYFWMSIATLIGFIWILYRFGFLPKQPELAVEGSKPRPEDLAVDAKPAKPADIDKGSGGDEKDSQKFYGLRKDKGRARRRK